MRRAAALAALALMPVAAAAAQEPDRTEPTFVLDARGDARGPLDVIKVAVERHDERRLRGEITMRRSWEAGDLRPHGSVCLKVYVEAEPDAEPPEYLVCATPPREGDELRGQVLRNRANGLPRRVATARVTRPSGRRVAVRFAESAIGTPASIGFAGEALTRGEGCPRATGCVDLGPDAPDVRKMRLHADAPSG
jgi:hypothetical protein